MWPTRGAIRERNCRPFFFTTKVKRYERSRGSDILRRVVLVMKDRKEGVPGETRIMPILACKRSKESEMVRE